MFTCKEILSFLNTPNRRLSEMLRLLLAVTAYFLLAIGVFSQTTDPKEAAAVSTIEADGGTVLRDGKAPGHPVIKVDLRASKAANVALRQINELTGIIELDLGGSNLSNEELEALLSLSRLEVLSIDAPFLNDACIPFLKNLTALKKLTLPRKITKAGLSQLPPSKHWNC